MLHRAFLVALVLFVVLADLGCNHSKRYYATCYCAKVNVPASTAPVQTLCAPCEDRDSHGQGKGHEIGKGKGHDKHH